MNTSDPILSIKNVYKVFGSNPEEAMTMLGNGADKDAIFEKTGQTVGVFDASFDVHKGEIFVVMGLSGSGKSTLVRLLNRLIEPTSGAIELNGRDITKLSEDELIQARRREMSMVFQSFALMPHMTVLENAAFGLEVSGVAKPDRAQRAQTALEQVGLGEHGQSYPHQLSGGMQQRVGLARALTNDPTILLMDEAFSALDPLIRYEMQGELIRLQREQKRTVIFISHDLDEAIRIGDRIAIMEGGRVVQIGTPQEILRNPANDYVEAFFKGVDVTKMLTAGDVAQLNSSLTIRLNGSVEPFNARPDDDYGYLIDENDHFSGIVDLEAIKKDMRDPDQLRSLQMGNPTIVKADASLKTIIQQVAASHYPVPVVDQGGGFRGTISKQQLLQTLSHG